MPPPSGKADAPPRALIFDSKYDDYRGVVAYIRVVDGALKKNDKLRFMATKSDGDALEVGFLNPNLRESPELATGEIGYVVTGLKEISQVRVGDTIARKSEMAVTEMLPGYKLVRPMVYAGVFPKEGDEYSRLRDAMEKLRLNDAALAYEPEQSTALGFGFRCGLLGMLHLEIVQERLRREHGLEVVVTTPSVAYEVVRTSGETEVVTSPLDFPDPTHVEESHEPWVKVDIVTPSEYFGNVMTIATDRRGIFQTTEWLDPTRAIMHFDMPLASVIVDFYDKLKSVTQGYASLNYEFTGYRSADIVRLDIHVAEELVPALSALLHRSEAEGRGRQIVETLRARSAPAFVIKIQPRSAARSSRRNACRRTKDVTGYLYGGDVTRKMKLLEKQKKGKENAFHGQGKVDIPPEAFIKAENDRRLCQKAVRFKIWKILVAFVAIATILAWCCRS